MYSLCSPDSALILYRLENGVEIQPITQLQEFLPQLADEAQTRVWVEEAIAQTGASEKKDMGKVMGALMGAHKAELDGNIARQIVQELLS